MEQSWLISHSGFVPSSTYAKLWFFFSLRQNLVVWSSTTCPGVRCRAAAAACQELFCRSMLPWALLQPGQQWAASTGRCAPLLMAGLEVENMWRNISCAAEADGSGHWTERTFLMCCAPTKPTECLNARIALNLKKRKISGKAERLKGLSDLTLQKYGRQVGEM